MGANASFYKIDIENPNLQGNVDYYTVRVQAQSKYGNTWTVDKCFNDFNKFSEELWKKFPKIPELPSQTLTKAKSSEKLNQRKAHLEHFLREIAKRPDIMTSQEADIFFQISQKAKELTLQMPIEAQNEGSELANLPLPVRDYDYIDEKQILIVLMVDLDESSRLYSKMRNFHWSKENYEIRRPVSIIRVYKIENFGDPMRLFQGSKQCLEMKFKQTVQCFKWNNNLNLLALGLTDGQLLGIELDLEKWDEDGKSMLDEDFESLSKIGMRKSTDFQPHYKPLTAIAVDDKHNRFISISADKTLKKSQIPKGQLIGEIQVDEGKLTCLSVDTEKQLAYVGTDSGIIALVNMTERTPYIVCKLYVCLDEPVSDILVDSVNNYIFASCKDWSSCVFLHSPGEEAPHKILDYPGRASNTSITWANEKRDVFVGDSHGNVSVWGLSQTPKYVWKAHKKAIFRVDYVKDHHMLFTASKDRTLKVWKLPESWIPEPWNLFNESLKNVKEEVINKMCAWGQTN